MKRQHNHDEVSLNAIENLGKLFVWFSTWHLFRFFCKIELPIKKANLSFWCIGYAGQVDDGIKLPVGIEIEAFLRQRFVESDETNGYRNLLPFERNGFNSRHAKGGHCWILGRR